MNPIALAIRNAISSGALPGPMKPALLVVLTLAALIFVNGQQSSAPAYTQEKNVAIPMRDGVALHADILRPKREGKFPVLVYRTPYGKDSALRNYSTFRHAVESGYVVVVEDVRGRYASDGEFRPYQNEGHDGYDTVEWAAGQTWSDGNVGTFGLSYPGAVQWLAAVENPPHLKAMVPAMTFSTPQSFFYAGGTWDMSWIEWIWNNIAPDARAKKDLPGPKNYKEAIAAWHHAGPGMLQVLPLNQLEELRGVAPYYYDWLLHPVDDPWWDWCELRNKYERVHAAVLNLSAWYDDNYGPEGATTNFSGLLKARAGKSDSRTHLLLGPWTHGVEETAITKAGEREFGPAAVINYDELILRWMDQYLRGIDNGVDKEKPVRYFVMGDNRWREADTWPPAAKPTPYYFAEPEESGTQGHLRQDGLPEREIVSSFVSDPANPVTNTFASSGAHDYRELAKRGDVLLFDSEPLDEEIEVTGPIHAKVYLSCDCHDLDLWVRLLDVAPDGTAFNLMSPGLDVQRVSYREASKGRQLLTPDQIYEVGLKNLITSNVFQKGHRIRAQVLASFFPNFSRNLQTGELETVSAKTRKARVSIYTGRAHPSQLVLPIVPR